jgi:phosphoserine phosphatase RsbU/P
VRRFVPNTRMGKFTATLIILWCAKSLIIEPRFRQSLSPGLQFALDLLGFLLIIPVIYYSWNLFASARQRLLWKIRRRLILAHIFIGAVPSILLLIILNVAALLFYYQLSYYLSSNQIGIHAGQIHAFNLSMRAHLERILSSARIDPAQAKAVFDQDVENLLGAYPSAAVVLRYEDPSRSKAGALGNSNVHPERLQEYQVPLWTGEHEFSGLVYEDFQPRIYAVPGISSTGGTDGKLYLRSLVSGESRPGSAFTVEISVPFDRYLLERLKAALGQELLLADRVPVSGLSVMLQTTELLKDNIICSTYDTDESSQPQSRSVWSIMLYPISWNSGTEIQNGDSQVLFVDLSMSRLFQNLFRTESNVSKTILGVLQIVIGFFLVVEIISLIVGILLTRSITSAVFNLDRGTQFIKRGDFSHRILLKSEDQLGALAESFNQMTEYVQSLVKERVQKERLERELEIAKEVQEQLFPRFAPRMQLLELTGLCLPARIVSGDYYDFLEFNDHRLGLALGDICGKGISAALLMANLQATLRSNVTNLFKEYASEVPDNIDCDVSSVVKRINRQIYHHTSANKFATFFYAVYDDSDCSLTYCNAGHNPPLFLDGGGCRRLMTGGTVVGIFPDATYDQETVQMGPGDVFVAYTDGILESVNEYGEEFGEKRIIDIIEKNRHLSAETIQKTIVERVLEWSFEEERDDDMTLIVAKVVENNKE